MTLTMLTIPRISMTTPTTPKLRPWQRHRERPVRREGVGLEPLPDAQICIYENSSAVGRTRRVKGGWRSYPVAPEVIAQALAGLPLSSGLLPPDALGWGMAHGEPYIVCYLPPRPVKLPLRLGRTVTTYYIQTPPLVW